jgi:hypothetical protein
MRNLKKRDMRAEQELAKYLDSQLYPFVLGNGVSYNRNHDLERQYRGSDIEFTVDGKLVVMDEKGQLNYINNNKHSYILEIGYYDAGNNWHDGWLIDRNMINHGYILVFPNAKTTDLDTIVSSDFRETTCLFVDKTKILNYLDSIGLSIDRLKNISLDVKNSGNVGYIEYPDSKDVFFYVSNGLNEKPLNIVVSRKVLDVLAYRIYNINYNREPFRWK